MSSRHFLLELHSPGIPGGKKQELLEPRCDIVISKDGMSFGTHHPDQIKWSHILKVRSPFT